MASGGVEQTRLLLARHFSKKNFELKITCSYAGNPIASEFEKLGVKIHVIGSMKGPFDPEVHKKAIKIIKGFRPHIIHGGVFEGNSIAAISGFLTGVPIRILEETSDPKTRSKKASWLLRQYVRLADKITAISPNVLLYLTDVAKISTRKVLLLNNGIQIPEYPSAEEIFAKKKELGLLEGEFVIGFVGRLYNDHKRITDLVDALAICNDPRLKLIIVGDGRDKGEILEKIDVLGLKESVILAGYQKNTSLYYSIFDLVCIPSAREGFGLVAAEAMIHRLPVIASNVGGLKDVILDSETGFLVTPLDPKELASKITLLFQNPHLRRMMGEKGYERALENFTSDRYCADVEALYLDLLKKKKILKND